MSCTEASTLGNDGAVAARSSGRHLNGMCMLGHTTLICCQYTASLIGDCGDNRAPISIKSHLH